MVDPSRGTAATISMVAIVPASAALVEDRAMPDARILKPSYPEGVASEGAKA